MIFGKAGKVSTFLGVTSRPACRVGCGSSGGWCATTYTVAVTAGDEAAPGESPGPHRCQSGGLAGGVECAGLIWPHLEG